MLRRLRRFFWGVVPHRHRYRTLATKYGCSCWCEKCGRVATVMDGTPWGD